MLNLNKKKKIKGKIFTTRQNGIVHMSKYKKSFKNKIIPIVVFSGFNLFGNKNQKRFKQFG